MTILHKKRTQQCITFKRSYPGELFFIQRNSSYHIINKKDTQHANVTSTN